MGTILITAAIVSFILVTLLICDAIDCLWPDSSIIKHIDE